MRNPKEKLYGICQRFSNFSILKTFLKYESYDSIIQFRKNNTTKKVVKLLLLLSK